MKQTEDDIFKFEENSRKFSKRVENTVGKGEIAHYEQFLLFPQCFQKSCFLEASKGVIVWEWVNCYKKEAFRKHCEKRKCSHPAIFPFNTKFSAHLRKITLTERLYLINLLPAYTINLGRSIILLFGEGFNKTPPCDKSVTKLICALKLTSKNKGRPQFP